MNTFRGKLGLPVINKNVEEVDPEEIERVK